MRPSHGRSGTLLAVTTPGTPVMPGALSRDGRPGGPGRRPLAVRRRAGGRCSRSPTAAMDVLSLSSSAVSARTSPGSRSATNKALEQLEQLGV